jgi:hypothetical protein
MDEPQVAPKIAVTSMISSEVVSSEQKDASQCTCAMRHDGLRVLQQAAAFGAQERACRVYTLADACSLLAIF